VAKDSDQLAGAHDTDNTNGLLAGLFAEENEFDRRTLWRIGSWGAAAVGAVVLAVYANQASLGWRREQVAAADLARQAQQIQQLTKEGQIEARKLASAIDTLNSDRDRLYSRVTVLEQGLDSVTGTIAKQAAAAKSEAQATLQTPVPPASPAIGPVAAAPATAAPVPAPEKPNADTAKAEPQITVTSTVPAPPAAAAPAPLVTAKSIMGPPDPAATKLIEATKPTAAAAPAVTPPPEIVASIPAAESQAEDTDEPKAAIQRTEFAVDLGSANSISGLRALWRGVVASNPSLKALNPIIMVRESKTGLGMQLRLAAGPLQDAATAAKICAALTEAKRGCETTVFDGQRLAMASGEGQPLTKPETPMVKSTPAKRSWTRHAKKEDPPQKQDPSTIPSWFGKKP